MDTMYYRTTKDFVTHDEAKVLLAPGYPVIGSSVYYHDGLNFMCFKDERGHNAPDTDYKALCTCVSKNAVDPYENISPLLTRNLFEGPTTTFR